MLTSRAQTFPSWGLLHLPRVVVGGGGGGVRKAGWLYHRTYRPCHASGVHVWWDWRSGCSILPLTHWGWGYGQRWTACRWGPLGTHSPPAALGAASWASWACTSRTTRTQWALQITCTWIRPLREKTWMVSKVWLIPVLNMSWEYGLYLSWTCPESMVYTCPEHVLKVGLIPVLKEWLIFVLNISSKHSLYLSCKYGSYLSLICSESMAFICPEYVLKVWLKHVLNISWKYSLNISWKYGSGLSLTYPESIANTCPEMFCKYSSYLAWK